MIDARRISKVICLAAVLGMIGAVLLLPARAQPPLPPPHPPMWRVRGLRGSLPPAPIDIIPPLDGLVVDRKAVLRWVNQSNPGGIERAYAPSITWYYTARPDGSDRQRLVTYFHDPLDGDFTDRWIPAGGARGDWSLLNEPGRGGRRFLRSQMEGSPLVSRDHWANAFVFSARLRPRPGAQHFGIGVRANQDPGAFYALRGTAELVNPLDQAFSAQKVVQEVDAARWYWYELSVRNQKKEVEVRARIWDENHERVLGTLALRDDSAQPASPTGQRVALLCGADYSEAYVDPWDARWAGPREGAFGWDTGNVPEGDYYLVAVVDGNPRICPQRLRVSDFKITVRHQRD
jgi:hypothetical protein